jgi:hypothetical protein
MLDLLEKIGAGVCAFLVVATLAVYGYLKLPDAMPNAWRPRVREVTTAAPPKASTGPAVARPEVSDALKAIAAKLLEQDQRVDPAQIVVKQLEVDPKIIEEIGTEANLIPTLKQLKSTVLKTKNGDTRIQLREIRKDSVLDRVGLKDNDVVELIDGEILEFNDSSTNKYLSLWREKLERLRAGQPLSVTVTRGGRRMQLEYRL